MERLSEPIKVLIVDSDDQAAESIRKCFDPHRYHCLTTTRAAGALELLKNTPISVAVCALRLIDMDGLELLRRGRIRSPHTSFLMMADPSDSMRASEAMRGGAFGCLQKPFEAADLVACVEQALDQQRSRVIQDILQTMFKETLRERAKHLHKVLQQSGEQNGSSLEMLVLALDTRDNYASLHSLRVQRLCVLLAKKCGFPPDRLKPLADGALLHDIGKIAIPQSILVKPDRLTAQEYQVMQQHTQFGYQVLSRVPHLEGAAMLALHHHERMDGGGYPTKLAGDAIPLEARIFAVADTIDAITAGRPYCAPRSLAQARAEIFRCRGSQFDSDVVEVSGTVSDEEWQAEIDDVVRRYTNLLPLFADSSEHPKPFLKTP